MATRAETTAATRAALLGAAAALLDGGGPEAVTLREVGARAGVSRSALYRHFADKDALLLELATRAWAANNLELEALRDRDDLTPRERVRDAFGGLIALARGRPHLYRLMFGPPPAAPNRAVRAAERSHDLLLGLVGELVGAGARHAYAALLLAAAHGAAGLELSGHLTEAKWHTDAEGLLALLVERLPGRV